LRFLNWIPLGYIFETNIIDTLRSRFLEEPEFRNVTMKCLTEIGGLQVKQYQYDDKLIEMFTTVMTTVSNIIPLTADLRAIYPTSNSRDQEFIQNLALFLCNFFTPHVQVRSNRKNTFCMI
jgi:exportin-1